MDKQSLLGTIRADFAVLARKKPVLFGLLLLPCLIFLLYVGSYYNPLVNVSDTEICCATWMAASSQIRSRTQ